MTTRKIQTYHCRKESLPEILAEIKQVLEKTDTKQKVLLIDIYNTGYFELAMAFEA